MAKVAVIGAGHVGATTAHLIALKGLADVVIVDIVEGLAEGKALDMLESAPIEGFSVSTIGSTEFEAVAGSDIVVVTAGLARKPGMSRDDLVAANAAIVGPICSRIAKIAPQAILIVVTNPLDVMVALAKQRSGFPRERVMGMAGILDSARLRTFISLEANVQPREVEAMILGSHGDLMVAAKSSIKVKGRPVSEHLSSEKLDAVIQRAKSGGAEIVKLLKAGSAFYAPASSVVQMVEAILEDTQAVLPCCVALEGEYGLSDICMGVPVQLGAQGAEKVVTIDLSKEESEEFLAAAKQVKEMIEALPSVS